MPIQVLKHKLKVQTQVYLKIFVSKTLLFGLCNTKLLGSESNTEQMFDGDIQYLLAIRDT